MQPSPARVLPIAGLIALSGCTALAYQTVWFREFRLMFGASTAATAAVMAVFMAGLGLGSLVLGRRADRHPRPLSLYAWLELGIAVTASLSPLLLWLVRTAYLWLGGTQGLGLLGGTLFRILMTLLVLGPPTFLMGGTLPAAVRAAETRSDHARRHLALLYGANTVGAVVGVCVVTFAALEILGLRSTLWAAALLNVLVVVLARSQARQLGTVSVEEPDPEPAPAVAGASPGAPTPRAPTALILVAAGTVGFAFFLLELVWYRMLGPILGGTTFTFGLILALALAGIGLGGGLYALRGRERVPSLAGFALTCTLEAALLALPLALGDGLAVLELLLRPLGVLGMQGHLASWLVIASIAIVPGAVVSGYQFPMLIALLGHGRDRVGHQLGAAYACNTVGAILGSLAGGFGLLPVLTAPGAWRLSVLLLLALGAAVMVAAYAAQPVLRPLRAPALFLVVAGGLLGSDGPSGAWRHGSIGTGRVVIASGNRNTLRDLLHTMRREVVWEAEGVESSVALKATGELVFVVNGKTDGSALGDSGTQVMFGLLTALRHGDPRNALVIGLGTGSTAGWLGAIPAMQRVDVAELEPAIVEVARQFAPVNRGVLANPKVQVLLGDGRELLLTAKARYDIILSEPSNPYRAGVASLYTREFYQSVAQHLAPGGVFGQWVQCYEIDSQTLRIVYATLASAFAHVETWQTQSSDLLLVASASPLALDVDRLRQAIQAEPFRSALRDVWRVDQLEGVLGHFVAPPELARQIAAEEGDALNTDDRLVLDFRYARAVGRVGLFSDVELLQGVRRRWGRQGLDHQGVDSRRVDLFRACIPLNNGAAPQPLFVDDTADRERLDALGRHAAGDLRGALATWSLREREPELPIELEMVAECLAEAGAPRAQPYLERLATDRATAALAIEARLRWRTGQGDLAVQALLAAWRRYLEDPWPLPALMGRSLALAQEMAGADPELAAPLAAQLAQPFAVRMLEGQRLSTRRELLFKAGFEQHCVEALAPFEPHPIWQQRLLALRARCYGVAGHPLRAQAEIDLERFLEWGTLPFFIDDEPGDAAAAP